MHSCSTAGPPAATQQERRLVECNGRNFFSFLESSHRDPSFFSSLVASAALVVFLVRAMAKVEISIDEDPKFAGWSPVFSGISPVMFQAKNKRLEPPEIIDISATRC